MTGGPHRELPLTGVRILDCSRVLAGPIAAMHLADLGADVVKLEPPAGDETRTWGPPFWSDEADGLSAYFSAVNRNKRAVVVDLKSTDGVEVFDKLVHRSDVLIHNFRPDTAKRLSLDAERLADVHPHLIVAAVTGFPGDQSQRARPAYDLLAQAISGLMAITGEADGPPTKVGVALLDLIAGLELSLAILAEYHAKHRFGGNRFAQLEVSLVEVGVWSLLNVLSNYLASGQEADRHGNAHPNIAPYQTFEVADGHVVIAVGNDAQFQRLLDALGLEDRDGAFSSNPKRLARREELDEWLGSAVRTRQRDGLVAALLSSDIPAGAVLSVGEAVRSMEAAHANAWVQEIGGVKLAPSPIHLADGRLPLRLPPPKLGEHTDEVLSEIGFTAAEVARLRDCGAIR